MHFFQILAQFVTISSKKIDSGAYGLTKFFLGPFFKLGHNYHAQAIVEK